MCMFLYERSSPFLVIFRTSCWCVEALMTVLSCSDATVSGGLGLTARSDPGGAEMTPLGDVRHTSTLHQLV